jgi:serine/threonine protein kinase/Tol biopolymer transport system component
MPLPAGTRLGRYEVRSLLGAGGMGEVYLARDTTELERMVAVKVLPAEMASDPERMRRFVQEARAASALNHPNIITIHEIGEADSSRFIVTEYVEGETLRQRMVRSRLSLREALDVAIQISSALVAAHKAGVVHRDIKPENVMVREDGIVKVLDFGLAKPTGRPIGQSPADSEAATRYLVNTGPGTVMGTVSYMSPEQARGLSVDERTDIWGLGVVLYEMVAGRAPFEGATAIDVLATILHREPSSLLLHRRDVPAELERIVEKALTKDREERHQTAKDLTLDLKRLRQRLETEAELERGVTPERGVEARYAATDGGHEVGTAPLAAARTGGAGDIHTTASSAEYLIHEIERHKLGAVLTLMGLVGLAALALILWARAASQPPKVTGYTKITNDSRLKMSFVSDGARIYYSSSFFVLWSGNYQVSAAGGESIPMPDTGLSASIQDISPDGAELLMLASTSPVGEFPLWVQPVLGGSPRRVGDLLAHSAAWSPDGSRIAYTSGADLLVAGADGREPRTLVSAEGVAELPRWSPDGRRVRFTVVRLKDRSSALWEVGADGANPHLLLPGWNTPPAECCGTWAADGRHFFFQSRRNGATNIWALDEGGGLFRAADIEPVQLTSGAIDFAQPVPRRDGKKLFAVGTLQRGELVRFDAKTGQFVPFMQGLSAEWVEFSRDGLWVAYVSHPDGTLWRSRADGTERLQLTAAPTRALMPRWSPDGRQIAFVASTPGQPWNAYFIQSEGGTPQPLLPELRDQLFSDPNWSPDGSRIVVGHTPQGEAANKSGIQIIDLRTKEVSTLPGSEGLFSPRWSPDGRYVCALSTDFQRLLLFDFTTRRWAELLSSVMAYPSWARDGKHIYVSGGVGYRTLMRVRVGDGRVEEVAKLKDIRMVFGAFGSWRGLAPDDSLLVLRDVGTQEIYALDLQVP